MSLDTTALRPAVRELLHLLKFRTGYGRPCYLKRNQTYAALIVPHLRAGADGPYSYLRTFKRATVTEAVNLGLVVVGEERVEVPAFDAKRDHWSSEPVYLGRTIELAPRTAQGRAS